MGRRTLGVVLAVVLAAVASGGGAGTTMALFTDGESMASSMATAASFSGTTYFLHNNPSPPTGDTNMQAALTMNTTAPTATTLYNYDADQDAAKGRLVVRGGSGATETNLTRYQNWRGPTTGLLGQTINGTVTVDFWSAIRNFAPSTAGEVTVYLRAYDTVTGLSFEIANTTVTDADWQDGSSSWVKHSASVSVNYLLLFGRQLEVKLLVGSGSADDIWFAYDTDAFRSRFRLP